MEDSFISWVLKFLIFNRFKGFFKLEYKDDKRKIKLELGQHTAKADKKNTNPQKIDKSAGTCKK